MYTANNSQPVANGFNASIQPQPAGVELKLLVYRNVETGQEVTIDGGKKVMEWETDENGQIVQEPVSPTDAKLHDTVIIKNWMHLAMSNPALAMQKLNDATALLPEGLRIAPAKGAQANYQLSSALGRPIKTRISSNGSWMGWVAKPEGSPSNPHAVTL